jgi:hypothetical protein
MKPYNLNLKLFSFVIVSLGLTACSQQTTEASKPRVIETAPAFVMELNTSKEQDKAFSAAFVEFAKMNHLNIDTQSEFPEHPANGEPYTSIMYEIYNAKKEAVFIITNPYSRTAWRLVIYPHDTVLVKHYTYDLVQKLVSTTPGGVTSISCDDKVLDCERLKALSK